LAKNYKNSSRTNFSLSSEIGPMDPNNPNITAHSASTPTTTNNMETTQDTQDNQQQIPNTPPPQNSFWSMLTQRNTPTKPETTTTTQQHKDPNDYPKQFVNITIKDWLRLTFTVSFFVPDLSTSYLFTIDLTKSGRITNLAQYPTQWICIHKDTTQSILFDFTSTNGNAIKISAKLPRSTRNVDQLIAINAYRLNKNTYTLPQYPKDVPLIPFSMSVELDTDEESNTSSNHNNDTITDTDIENILTLNANSAQQSNTDPSLDQQPPTISKKGKERKLSNTHTQQPNLNNYNQGASSSNSNRAVPPHHNSNETDKQPKLLYSQITSKHLDLPTFDLPDEIVWAETMREKIMENINTQLDQQKWNYESITTALQTPEGIQDLVTDKLAALPTTYTIPPAIMLKFKHRDTRFFTTFTRNTNTKPAHQKEFTELYNNALTVYKQSNDITITDTNTRSTINTMLKKMLIAQYITNTNMAMLTPIATLRIMHYARGFLQIRTDNEETAKAIKLAINRSFQNRLAPLPSHPDLIPKNTKDILPFALPVKHKSQTTAIVNALRKIFSFEQLPNSYFVKLPPPPTYCSELPSALQRYFPIKQRQQLQHLAVYRKKLADYYECETIPNSYFQLPPPKVALPTAYQELNPKVRQYFPYNSATAKIPLRQVINQLRHYYTFKLLPSDFFITKPLLPTNPQKIYLKTQYTYPITEDTTAKAFIQEASQRYRIRLPLAEDIMQANPTNKPTLPVDYDSTSIEGIALPLTTKQQLINAVKTLRQFYYFAKLPEEWIDIPQRTVATKHTNTNTQLDNNTPATKPLPTIPDNIEDIQQTLQACELQITLPITQQADVTSTMQTLRQHFTIKTIPACILQLPPLPPPTWNIFQPNNNNNISTAPNANTTDMDIS
jgi:hypothetical protein